MSPPATSQSVARSIVESARFRCREPGVSAASSARTSGACTRPCQVPTGAGRRWSHVTALWVPGPSIWADPGLTSVVPLWINALNRLPWRRDPCPDRAREMSHRPARCISVGRVAPDRRIPRWGRRRPRQRVGAPRRQCPRRHCRHDVRPVTWIADALPSNVGDRQLTPAQKIGEFPRRGTFAPQDPGVRTALPVRCWPARSTHVKPMTSPG